MGAFQLIENKQFQKFCELYERKSHLRATIIKELQKERKTFNGEVIQLKEYEIPKYFTVVEKFPRTKADKIDYMASFL